MKTTMELIMPSKNQLRLRRAKYDSLKVISEFSSRKSGPEGSIRGWIRQKNKVIPNEQRIRLFVAFEAMNWAPRNIGVDRRA
jgi:hypothetical protein